MIDVLLDIETAPEEWQEVASTRPLLLPPQRALDHARTRLFADGPKTEADRERIASAALEWWRKGSLNSRRGVLVCAGVQIRGEDEAPGVSEIGEQATLDMLDGALDRAGRIARERYSEVRIVAHGGAYFDFPFVWERAVVHKRWHLARQFARVMRYGPARQAGIDPGNAPYLLDTMEVYATTAPRGRDPVTGCGPMKQRILCESLGLDVPEDPLLQGGAGVLDALLRGNTEIVREHCRVDLLCLGALVDRLEPLWM